MRSNELPFFVFSRAGMKADADGIYVFTGSGACALTVADGSIQLINGVDTSGLRLIKNRGTANVTITATLYESAAVASIVVAPGQSALLAWDGTKWCVIASQALALATAASLASYYATASTTVAALPAAASSQGQRRTVTDASVAFSSANLATTVAGGGANVVPVWCNGTNWLIG